MKSAAVLVLTSQLPPVAAAAVLAATRTPIVTDSGWLTALLIIGASGGALMAVAVWPPDATEPAKVVRRLALKFGASLLGGITFGPLAVRLLSAYGLPVDGDTVMASGAAVAALIVSTLHFAAPKYERLVKRLADRIHHH